MPTPPSCSPCSELCIALSTACAAAHKTHLGSVKSSSCFQHISQARPFMVMYPCSAYIASWTACCAVFETFKHMMVKQRKQPLYIHDATKLMHLSVYWSQFSIHRSFCLNYQKLLQVEHFLHQVCALMKEVSDLGQFLVVEAEGPMYAVLAPVNRQVPELHCNTKHGVAAFADLPYCDQLCWKGCSMFRHSTMPRMLNKDV